MGKLIFRKLLSRLKLAILPNAICTNQNLSRKTRRIKFSGTLRYKWIIQFWLKVKISQEKKTTCHQADFDIQGDHWVKQKESKKIDKYLDFARELKKLWKIKRTVIPIIVRAIGTFSKSLEKRLQKLEKWKRIDPHPQKNPLHSWAPLEYLKECWRPEKTCCPSDPIDPPQLTLQIKTDNNVEIKRTTITKATEMGRKTISWIF